jgi:polyferredoxin
VEGYVENVYTLKIINMDERAHHFRVDVSGLEGLELVMSSRSIEVPGGEVRNLPVSVRIDPVVLERTANQIQFTLSAEDASGLSRTESGRFLGPVISR